MHRDPQFQKRNRGFYSPKFGLQIERKRNSFQSRLYTTGKQYFIHIRKFVSAVTGGKIDQDENMQNRQPSCSQGITTFSSYTTLEIK